MVSSVRMFGVPTVMLMRCWLYLCLLAAVAADFGGADVFIFDIMGCWL